MDWMSVSGWMSKGGAELGTSRKTPTKAELPLVAEQLEAHGIDGLCIIGGWGGYETVYQMWQQREIYPAFNIPMVCLPTTINNNLPGSEHSIGADTALNSIVEAVDKIKQSAVATNRCFVVEVMGRDSGYLALISGLATGAERVYIPEEGVSLTTLEEEVAELIKGFQSGKRLGLIIRSERADHLYTTGFMRSLFEKEGGDLFDVRQAILGHIQQGGNPSPYDRIQATRLAARCIDYLAAQSQEAQPGIAAIGLQGGQVQFTDLREFPNLIDGQYQRPKEQWWLRLREVAKVLDHPLSE
jgi:6-phosphofructokinase 1